jgi:hypothetical protein
LRHSAANFPTEAKKEIEIGLEDLEAEIMKSPADRNPTRIKQRLKSIFAAGLLIAGTVAGTADFTNTAIELGEKFDINLPALMSH